MVTVAKRFFSDENYAAYLRCLAASLKSSQVLGLGVLVHAQACLFDCGVKNTGYFALFFDQRIVSTRAELIFDKIGEITRGRSVFILESEELVEKV